MSTSPENNTDNWQCGVLPSASQEIEVLGEIYRSDGFHYDAEHRIISISGIQITSCQENSEDLRCADLWISLPFGYPDTGPPSCQVYADWLSDTVSRQICVDALTEIENGNSSEVLYDLIESMRRRLQTQNALMLPPTTDTKVTETEDMISGEEIVCVLSDDECPSEACVELPSGLCEIFSTEVLIDRHSTFQAHVAAVFSYSQVCKFREQLLQNSKIARATHNIMAYRIRTNTADKTTSQQQSDTSAVATVKSKQLKSKISPQRSILSQDKDSDGEHGAGGRLQHLLSILDVHNVAVIVTRWYGGIHLGPVRFKHINNIARRALDQFGFLNVPPASNKTTGRPRRR